MNLLPLVGEFVGTFLLTMSVFASGSPVVIGLTLAIVVFVLSDISGGNVNPAISMAMYVKGALSAVEFFTYSFAQCAGAVSAWYAYKVLV